MARADRAELVRGLGLLSTTALVAGNVIGSGIYSTPGALAAVAGPLSLLAWPLVALAYVPLTVLYADLATAYPISGGLQVYAQRGLGDLAGFAVAFLYWLSGVIGNAAFLTAFTAYAAVFFPGLAAPLAAFALAQLVLWSFTGLNVLGVRIGAGVGLVATALKVLPLFVLAIALLARAHPAHLEPFAPHGWPALWPAISLVAWLFVGAECVGVPAEEVRDASRTLRRASFAGYALAAGTYLLVALALGLGLPAAAIAGGASPLAVAARAALGPWGETLITLGALVSIAGVLNGWLLVVGRLPFAAARSGLLAPALAKIDPRTRTPVRSLVLSSAVSGACSLLYFNRTLVEAYNFVALASTALSLVAIGVACVAHLRLVRREPERFQPAQRRRGPWLAGCGLGVVTLLAAGSGAVVLALTALLVVASVPLYAWLRPRGQLVR
ncbi:MAG TPA: APC family permease [Candidatus Polarisedimenticolaceae bacterium]|nr:APC family permease [Candidatus Polarisedimenticolaceae bacterium]